MNLHIQIHRCKYQHIAPFWDAMTFFNTCWRLYYNESSGAAIQIRGQTTQIEPDHLYLLPPGLSFSTTVKNDPKQFFLHFDVGAPYNHVNAQIYPLALDPWFTNMLQLAKSERLPPPHFVSDKGMLYAMSLLSKALSEIPESNLNIKPMDTRIANAMERFRVNVARRFNIEDEAQAQGMTKSSFIRLFKRETGDSPYAYLIKLRIQQGCDLLLRTHTSIDEIAASTGFTDRFHFSKVFKQQTGASPGYYRKYYAEY
ncbi:MAG: helix-turn-helix domain-containing protein [Verrucomicrobiota bacterium]